MSEEPAPFALEAKGLAKTFPYGDEVLEILTDVDLGVVAGKSVSIRGESGCGKTTLLNVLSAFIPDDERIITIEDSAELQLQQDQDHLKDYQLHQTVSPKSLLQQGR